MRGLRKAIIILMLIQLSCASAPARQEASLEAYYFFSHDCPGCTNIAPFIKKLSSEITMQGFPFEQGKTNPMPFKVRQDDEDARRRYDVRTFPTLVIMKNSVARQIFIGEQDVKDARAFLNAFRKGAWSVSEVIEIESQNEYSVIGWIVIKGEYFRDPRFFLTDRRQAVLVKPWLPLEVVKVLT